MNLISKFITTAAVTVVATISLTGAANAATQSAPTPKPYTVVYGGYYSAGPHTMTAGCAKGDTRTTTKLTGTENLLTKKQTNNSRSSTVVFTVKPGKMAHPIFTISCKPGN
jgi:hypothetical protein